MFKTDSTGSHYIKALYFSQLFIGFKVRSLHAAILGNIRINYRFQTNVPKPSAKFHTLNVSSFFPSVYGYKSILYIHANCNLIPIFFNHFHDKIKIPGCYCSKYYPANTQFKILMDSLLIPDTTAHLNKHVNVLNDGFYGLKIYKFPILRSIQVHDMKIGCTFFFKTSCNFNRAAAVYSHLVIIPLKKTNCLAIL